MTEPTVTQANRTEAIRIGQLIADRCQPPRKPGQAPERYDTIMQAAKMGALEAMNNTRTASAPAGKVACPHEAYTVDTAGQPDKCADCGDRMPDASPSHPPAPADLVEALSWYANQFCELGVSHDCCGRLSSDDCSGCLARAVLAKHMKEPHP